METLNNEKAERINQDINDTLKLVNQWLENKEQSHAYIIGYLQGALKNISIALNVNK